MVYVFGLDIPLIEIQLIFLVLIVACLAFILIELKKLRQILDEQRNVVEQFKQDLKEFENSDGKVHNDKLQEYVDSALAKGVLPEQLRKVLLERGWEQEIVEKVLDSVV
ncbi:hypothetical protein ACFL1B_02240 [Nanoarchaeota archaeon]